MWRVYDCEFDWFRLKKGKYIKLQPEPIGIIKIQIYPGLWLDFNALLEGNLAKVLAVLQQGIVTEEPQKFRKKLNPVPE